MRCALSLLATALLGNLCAQDLRLVDSVPAPLAYVAVAPGTEPGAPGLETLLDDPTVSLLLAAQDGGATDAGSDPSIGALRRFRDLLTLSTGELELVLTGLLPRADAPALPLLLGRVRLSEDGRTRLEQALSDPAVAEPGREVAGHRIFALKTVSRRRPGSLFEVALVGRDLLVTNHVSSIEEVLHASSLSGPKSGTSTGADDAGSRRHPESLGADPAFRSLRERLRVGPGTALVHLDWRRLRERALREIGDGQQLFLQGAGLLSADHVALGLRTVDGALLTTILVDQPGGADGLLAVARRTPVRKLAQDLPGHGLAAVAFTVEPQRLRELAPRGAPLRSRPQGAVRADAVPGHGGFGSFHANLVGGCRRVGLDFEAQVVPRLGDGGSCRLVLLNDGGREAVAALSFRARSARSARSLYEDVRDNLERSQLPVERRGRGDREVAVIDTVFGGASIGAVGDSIVFGMHADLVERVSELDREVGRRDRARGLAATQALLDRLVDLRDLDARAAIGVLEVDGGVLGGQSTRAAGRHAGVILLDEDAIRIELISPL